MAVVIRLAEQRREKPEPKRPPIVVAAGIAFAGSVAGWALVIGTWMAVMKVLR